MIVYKGDATDMSEMTQEEMQAVMAKWAEWMQEVGLALTDIGAPFGPSSSIVDDGSPGTAVSLTGYSIVEADNMDAARALADNHPFLSEGKGDYAIDLYEMMPVPTMDG
jgi:hypothetical protein